jgi:hypothetical protein
VLDSSHASYRNHPVPAGQAKSMQAPRVPGDRQCASIPNRSPAGMDGRGRREPIRP